MTRWHICQNAGRLQTIKCYLKWQESRNYGKKSIGTFVQKWDFLKDQKKFEIVENMTGEKNFSKTL